MTERNPFEQIFSQFAEGLSDAPGASRLARLARTAEHVPDALIDYLAQMILRLDDVQLVGDDVAAHIFEISHCDARCINATAFAIALGKRLQHYLDNPVTADGARAELRERVAWWRIALSRAGDLARWPALVLNNGDRQNG